MMSTLHLIPGIASDTIMPCAHRCDNLQPGLQPSFVDQVRCNVILDPGPDFVRVDEWQFWPPTMRPRAQQQASLVVQHIGALTVGMIAKIAVEVIVEHCLNG